MSLSEDRVLSNQRGVNSETCLGELESICEQLKEWKRKYKKKIDVFGISFDIGEAMKAIDEIKAKENNRTLNVVVIGETCSGKSLLVNIFLRKEVARSGLFSTTPCPLKIQKTEESRAFYETQTGEKMYVDLTSKQELSVFQNLTDKVSGQQASQCINLYLPISVGGPDSLLSTNCTLMDTPGLNGEDFMTGETEKLVKEADVLVMVLDVTNAGGNTQTMQLAYEKRFIVAPNVLLICNKCEKLEKETRDRSSNIIRSVRDLVIENFTNVNGPYGSEEEAAQAIFFVSCKEVWKRLEGDGEDYGYSERLGYTKSENRLSTDNVSRRQEFRTFESSLRSLVQKQRESKKAERILKAVKRHKRVLIDTAMDVQNQLLALESVLRPSNARSIFCQPEGRKIVQDHFMRFVKTFYKNEIGDGEIKVDGKEKVVKFLDFIVEEGSEEIITFFWEQRSCFFCDSQNVDQLRQLITQCLSKAIREVVDRDKDKCIESFHELLNPVDEGWFEILLKRIKEGIRHLTDGTENRNRWEEMTKVLSQVSIGVYSSIVVINKMVKNDSGMASILDVLAKDPYVTTAVISTGIAAAVYGHGLYKQMIEEEVRRLFHQRRKEHIEELCKLIITLIESIFAKLREHLNDKSSLLEQMRVELPKL